MSSRVAYDYAIIRVVPRIERGEFVNAGVVLFSAARRFLGCRLALPAERLGALAPGCDVGAIARHLDAFRAVCEGDAAAGDLGALSASERFHWLAAPRSTVIQTSPIHGGVCEDPAAALEDLFARLVS